MSCLSDSLNLDAADEWLLLEFLPEEPETSESVIIRGYF
jgi:hypothetical protein